MAGHFKLTVISGDEAVDTEGRVFVSNLFGLDLGQSPDGIESRVLGQRQRNRLERIGEPSERVLLDCLDLQIERLI